MGSQAQVADSSWRFLLAANFFGRLGNELVRSPVLPLLVMSLGGGPAAVGLAGAVAGIVGTLARLPIGAVLDVADTRRPLLLGGVLFALVPPLYLAARALPLVVAVRVAHALAPALFSPSSMAIAAGVGEDGAEPGRARAGARVGWVTSSKSLASVFGGAIAAWILQASGFGAAFLASSLAGLLALGCVAAMGGRRPDAGTRMTPETPAGPGASRQAPALAAEGTASGTSEPAVGWGRATPRAPQPDLGWRRAAPGTAQPAMGWRRAAALALASSRAVLREGSLWTRAAPGALAMAMQSCTLVFLPVVGAEHRWPILWIGGLVAFHHAFLMLAGPPVGRFVGRVGPRAGMAAGLLAGAVGFVPILLWPTPASGAVAAASAALANATGGTGSLLAMRSRSRQAEGATTGLWSTLMDLGEAAGAVGTGVAAAVLGMPGAFGLWAGLALVGAAAAFAPWPGRPAGTSPGTATAAGAGVAAGAGTDAGAPSQSHRTQ